MAAALTELPVFVFPSNIQSAVRYRFALLDRADAWLCRKTLAIGKAGAINAALLAASALALNSCPALATAARRLRPTESGTSAVTASGAG